MAEKIMRLMNALFFDKFDWCRCGLRGYWYEQIDGVKVRKVTCPNPKHWQEKP